MKVIGFKICFLILLLHSNISFGKIVFEPKKTYTISLIWHFLQNNIFPDIRNVKIVNFGYDKGNPEELQILMKSLHKKFSEGTLMLSDFNETVLDHSDHVLLLLLTANQIGKVFHFINEIKSQQLELINAVIVFHRDFTKEQFTKLYDKLHAENFKQIIYAFPSFEPPAADGVPFEVDSKTLIFYLENLILSKLSSILKIAKFNTNEWKIHRTLKMLQRQQKHYMEQINKYPSKVLLFLRPFSVERSPPNSTEPFTGVAINILKIVTKSLGSPYFLELGRPEEYGTYYANNTPTRVLTDLTDGNVHIAINEYPVMKSGRGITTVAYDHEEYCFIMLMPPNQLRKWSVLMPFKTSVWISLFLIHSIVLVIFMFIREKRWKVIWLFQSAVSASHFPATRNSQRFFWSNWLFFHIIINASYTSFFVTQLVPKKKQHPYKTLQELVNSNITFLSEAGHFQEIQDSFPDKKLTPYYGKALQINGSSALLTSYMTRLKLFKLFGCHFYKVDECLLRSAVGPLTSTGNPNYESAVRIMHHIVAAGLKKHWLEIYLNAAYLTGNKSKIDDNLYEKEEYASLKVKELENVFTYFALGLVLSTIVFFFEMVQLKINKPRSTVRPEIVRVFPYTD